MKRKRAHTTDDDESEKTKNTNDEENVEHDDLPLRKKQKTKTKKTKNKVGKTRKRIGRVSKKSKKLVKIDEDEESVSGEDENKGEIKDCDDGDTFLNDSNLKFGSEDEEKEENEENEEKLTSKYTKSSQKKDEEKIDFGKFDTPESIHSSRTDYKNIFPLLHFFIDNPTQNLQNLLMFDMLGNCFKNLPEIALFTKPKESKIKTAKPKLQTMEDYNLGIKKDVSSIVFGNQDNNNVIIEDANDDDNKSQQNNEDDTYYTPETVKDWTIASEWKQLIDTYKNHSHCWYPIRKSVSYPPPKRKTSVTAAVAFYASRMRTTELTFRSDRQPVVSGNIVRNALSEVKAAHIKDKKSGTQTKTNSDNDIVSPFVPMWKNVFKQRDTTRDDEDDFSSSSSSSASYKQKKRDIKFSQEEKSEIIQMEYSDKSVNHVLGELLTHGPVFRAIMDSLKTGLQFLVGKRLSKDPHFNSSQSPKPESDKMVISDGINIGYMYNKSWEVLGSARLHYRNNTRLQLVTKSYRESQAIHVGENSGYRPCNRGQSCVCTKVKARQDILESRQQRSQAFTAAEFLLPNQKFDFLMYGKLPKENGPCVMCDTMITNLIVSFYVREGFEANHPIQSHGVIIGNTDNDYRLSDILPYSSGPKENLNGLIAPYPKYKEQDVIYVVLKMVNHEFKRLKIKQSASHFYTASITNIMESQLLEQKSHQKKNKENQDNSQKFQKVKIPVALETLGIIKKLDYQALEILTENLQTLKI